MLKKPLFVSIFILLFIGLSDYSYGCHKPGSNDQKGCDVSNFFTPFVVYFDDWEGDAIQSDRFGWDPPLLRDPELAEFPPSSYINEEESVGVGLTDEGHGGSGFNMNLRAGGGRKLFVNFGAIVDCGGCKFDCVEDDSDPPFVVECPFPSGLRAKQDESQNGTPDEFVCSAFVKASLYELAAFDLLGEIPELRIQYMDARPRLCLLGDEEFCPPQCPGEDCVGPVLSLEGGGSISFRVPKPKGKQHTSWSIRFGDESGSCSMQSQPGFPDYLSIRALDTDSRGIGGFRADTWNIGTFETFGYNDPRLGCLTKLKGDEFIGFFEMSFMYTMEIKPVGLGE